MGEPFGLWFGGSHMGFGTHMPTLAAAVLEARPGPVLEYGMGFYSSPLLYMMCEEMGRELLSLDHDAAWLERFSGMRTPWHRMEAPSSWGASEAVVDAMAQDWAVVLIDHGPDARRVVDATRLANRAEFVVVHDWEQSPSQAQLASLFKYTWVSRCAPQTAVLSNVRLFSGLRR